MFRARNGLILQVGGRRVPRAPTDIKFLLYRYVWTHMNRRRFISTAAGAGVGGLAGCIGGIFGDEEPTTYPANESRAFNDISYENGELMIDINDVYPAVWNNGKHPNADEEIPARVRRVSSYELNGPEGEAIPRTRHQAKEDIPYETTTDGEYTLVFYAAFEIQDAGSTEQKAAIERIHFTLESGSVTLGDAEKELKDLDDV